VVLYYHYPRKVKYIFEGQYEIENPIEHPFLLTSSPDALSHILNSPTNPFLPFAEVINISNLDFDHYDYLITFGRHLTSLTYTPYYALKYDQCPFLKKKPIKATYDTDIIGSYICVYKLEEKNKYRLICP